MKDASWPKQNPNPEPAAGIRHAAGSKPKPMSQKKSPRLHYVDYIFHFQQGALIEEEGAEFPLTVEIDSAGAVVLNQVRDNDPDAVVTNIKHLRRLVKALEDHLPKAAAQYRRKRAGDLERARRENVLYMKIRKLETELEQLKSGRNQKS
ncbi:MAG TPA: hypothetical protein PKZ07_14505 [Sedimentisphaerales bacterium]|nr:hypothetical protein [Sedimentisphaerales bacterium]